MVIFRDYSGLTILINLTYYESNTGIMLALKPMFFSQLLEMMDGNAKHDAASLLLNIITDWKADDHIIKQAFSKLQSDLNLCCQLIVCATNHTSLKEIEDDFVKYRKQLIPDAFAIQALPLAANFESWINTLITKVHAASHGHDAAREWIAVVKRDPDIDKYQSAESLKLLTLSWLQR